MGPSQKETIVFQPSIFRCELLVSGRPELVVSPGLERTPRRTRSSLWLSLTWRIEQTEGAGWVEKMDGWNGGLVGVSFTWLVVFFVGDLKVDWILCPFFFSNLTFRFGRRDSQNLPVAYGLGLRWTDTSKPLWIMRATWCHLACCGDVEHGNHDEHLPVDFMWSKINSKWIPWAW